jgi:hypothetical protein
MTLNQWEQMELDIQTTIKKCIEAREKFNNPDTPKEEKDFIESDCPRDLDYYSWPGMYPLYYLTKDGGVLCPKCANDNINLVTDPDDPQWYIVACDANYENNLLYCDHCDNRIESAYADDAEV